MVCVDLATAARTWMLEGQLCLLPWMAVGFALAAAIGPGTILVGMVLDARRWARG